jgi:TonB family protein
MTRLEKIKMWMFIFSLSVALHLLGAPAVVGVRAQEATKPTPDYSDGVQLVWRQFILTQMQQQMRDDVGVVQKIRGEDNNRVIVIERYVQDLSQQDLSRITQKQKREFEQEAREYINGWLDQSVDFMTVSGSPQDQALATFAKSQNLQTKRDLIAATGIEEITVLYPELELRFGLSLNLEGADTVRRISTSALLTNATDRVYPNYPDKARRAGVQGPVQIEVVVDEHGDVISAKAAGGDPVLHEAALEAAQQWKFQPFLVRGKPSKVSGILTLMVMP